MSEVDRNIDKLKKGVLKHEIKLALTKYYGHDNVAFYMGHLGTEHASLETSSDEINIISNMCKDCLPLFAGLCHGKMSKEGWESGR